MKGGRGAKHQPHERGDERTKRVAGLFWNRGGPGSLLDAASGMRPDAFCFHVAVGGGGKGKILQQKFPCTMSGWTTGCFRALGMIFRPPWSRIPQRQVPVTRWSRQLIAQQAVWRCLVADSRGRSRTEHAVARVSAPIKFGARGLLRSFKVLAGSCWSSLRSCSSSDIWAQLGSPRLHKLPRFSAFSGMSGQAWGGRNATQRRGNTAIQRRSDGDSAPKVTVSYCIITCPTRPPSSLPQPVAPLPPSRVHFAYAWFCPRLILLTLNAAADLVMPRPGTAIARFYPCTPLS